MLKDKITTYYQRNPRLKVLFFFDPEGEYLEEIRALDLPAIKVVEFASDWFNLKLKFNTIWRMDRVFLYMPMKSPQTKDEMSDFPLLGLLKANKELRTDSETDFMEEYGLKANHAMLVKRYINELKYAHTQQVLKPILNAAGFVERDIQKGLVCAFLSLSKIEDWDTILIRLLTFGLPNKEKELTSFFKKVDKYNLKDYLNKQINTYFDTSFESFTQDEVIGLVKRLKYNSITQGLLANPQDPYRALKTDNQNCIELLNRLRESGYAHASMGIAFQDTMRIHGAAIMESKLIEVYGMGTSFVYMTDALKWELIVKMGSMFPELGQDGEAILDKLSIEIQEEGMMKMTISFLRNSLTLLRKADLKRSLVFDKPEHYIEEYIHEFAQVDFCYRKAILSYHNLQLEQLIGLEENLEQIKLIVDDLYGKFTYKLNREWLECLNDKGFEYAKINCAKQYDFFTNKIAPLKQKVAVIISDGLRYEVATELLNELYKDDKNISKINVQLASLPSETSFGMANLLPGKHYAYDGQIRVDGETLAGVEQRDKILKIQSPGYKAVTFETVLNGNKQENRELFKSDVVYIYHDIIDKEGHKGTERNVFQAAQTAIAELAGMVKRIQGGYGVNRVFITSDHGFIYNDCDIEEFDKNNIAACECTDAGARHYITAENPDVEMGYKVSLYKTTKYNEPYRVVIPDSVNRFKKQGSRYRYTHGGGSLQELLVPVIESSRREDKVQRKVKPILFGTNLSIASNNLKVTIIQENPLSSVEKLCVVELGIYNDTQLVSNKAEITLNAVGESPNDRIFTTVLTLNTKVLETVLKLKVFDKEDLLNPLIEESVKNNTLIERDF